MSTPSQVAWIFPECTGTPATRDEVLAFLDRQEQTDRGLLALRYGYALDLGAASWVQDLDAALAFWRLRSAFTDWDGASAPPELERGLAAVLVCDDAPSDTARRVVERLPVPIRSRLEINLAGTREVRSAAEPRSGLGIGTLALILLAAGAFLSYGVYHDIDPWLRGKRFVRLGDYAAARASFGDLGALPEAHAWVAFTWLAEGQYDKAFDILLDPMVRAILASFRPMDEPLESADADPESGALLPRGLITITRPTFIYDPGPEGVLTLIGQPLNAGEDELRPIRIPIPDTTGGLPLARLEFPPNLPPLKPGVYQWWVPGSEQHPAAFTLLDPEQRREIQDRAWRVLNQEIPTAARTFLRAHYYLRNHLYQQAAEHFADLALEFTREPYPRRMLSEAAAALGVDPSAFLR